MPRHGAVSQSTRKRFVVFTLDDERYALDLGRVHRALRVVAVTPLPQAPPVVLGVVNLAGTVVPVIDLRRRFDKPPRPIRLSDHLVVAATLRRTVALLVDEATGVVERPADEVATAGEILPGLEFTEGAVKLDDGLILIHDLDRLLSLEEDMAVEAALEAATSQDSALLDAGQDTTGPEPSAS